MQTIVKHHMPKAKKATAALGSPAPLPLDSVDPLVRERTRFSPDRTHRFTLFRHWGDVEDYACGISMNPSGATEEDGDQTVDGMCDRARNYWGVGAYYQLNVMSIRGTYSDELGSAQTLSLPENDKWIREIAPKARFVVVSWEEKGIRLDEALRLRKYFVKSVIQIKSFALPKIRMDHQLILCI